MVGNFWKQPPASQWQKDGQTSVVKRHIQIMENALHISFQNGNFQQSLQLHWNLISWKYDYNYSKSITYTGERGDCPWSGRSPLRRANIIVLHRRKSTAVGVYAIRQGVLWASSILFFFPTRCSLSLSPLPDGRCRREYTNNLVLTAEAVQIQVFRLTKPLCCISQLFAVNCERSKSPTRAHFNIWLCFIATEF
jgi:hypothetical protein